MHIVRFCQPGGRAQVGVADGGIAVIPGVDTLGQLWQLSRDDLRALVNETSASASRLPSGSCRLLAPLDARTEVWASGVTYERSRDARVEESGHLTVYGSVYDADRPELFLKSVAWRVVTDGEPAGIRADAVNSVPEPELALVINSRGEIAGATVCDDLTARSVEGDNPLYLPQAKIYAGGCALAARIRPWWEIADPYDLDIGMSIIRSGTEIYTGSTTTAHLHRRFDDLVRWLYRHEQFPDGAILSTGTGIVPPLELGLVDGDVVKIVINQVGVLEHRVTSDIEAFGWLTT